MKKTRLPSVSELLASIKDAGEWEQKRPWPEGRCEAVELVERDFSAFNLSGIHFENCEIRDTDFEAADLTGACFTGEIQSATFQRANLSQADFSSCTIVLGRLTTFVGAVGCEVDFRKACLRDVCFRSACLPRAQFSRADLREADLSLANLSEARFESCKLRGATLRYSILTSVRTFRRKQVRECDLYGIKGASVANKDVFQAILADSWNE